MIARSILPFENCELVSEIVVVTSEDRFEMIQDLDFSKVKHIVKGGRDRHYSVWNGIKVSSNHSTLLAVHDGARPLVTTGAIIRCAEVAEQSGAATLAHRIVDTLKRSRPGESAVFESVSRDDLWAMETPQIFQRDILVSAYERVLATNTPVTDEVSAAQAIKQEVQLVENREPNFKITIPADLELAARLMEGA